MCLVTDNPVMKKAEKHIVCYKKLKFGYLSPFREFTYFPIPIPQTRVGLSFWRRLDGAAIYEGYHSFVNYRKGNEKIDDKRDLPNVLMLIPKRSDYVEGVWEGNDTIKNYASSRIVRLGHVYNPLSWMYLLFYKLFIW